MSALVDPGCNGTSRPPGPECDGTDDHEHETEPVEECVASRALTEAPPARGARFAAGHLSHDACEHGSETRTEDCPPHDRHDASIGDGAHSDCLNVGSARPHYFGTYRSAGSPYPWRRGGLAGPVAGADRRGHDRLQPLLLHHPVR